MEFPVQTLGSLARFMMTVDMFPVFFLADFTISAILVRNDSSHLGPKFRQKHPFTSWLCTLLAALSGAFVASFIFGDPLLNILQDSTLIAYLTIIWYAVNYSPYDIVYKLVMHPVFKIPANVLQECVRVRFLYLGLVTASIAYPKAPLIIMIGGIIKGNGYGFIKMLERLFRGLWNPKSNEILELSYFTKSGVLGSFVFLLHHYKLLRIQIEFLYLGVICAFVIGRLLIILGGVTDPLAPIEAPFCKLLFGSWEEEKVKVPKSNVTNNGVDTKGIGDTSKNNNNYKRNGSEKKSKHKKKE